MGGGDGACIATRAWSIGDELRDRLYDRFAQSAPGGRLAERVLLVDLDLEPAIRPWREAATQRGGEAVVIAAVRVVAPYAQRRNAFAEQRGPARGERTLMRPPRVVQDADIGLPHDAVEHWGERVT